MNKKRLFLFLASLLIIVIAVLLVTLINPTGKTISNPELKGEIRISGAWALYPMMVQWAQEFEKIYPEVKIDVSAGGAGKGATDALSGLVDIGMISREITPEEIEKGAFYIPVVTDAVFPTINENNPEIERILSTGFTKEEFSKLWISEEKVSIGEITGTDNLQSFNVYTRSDSCGAAETWAKYLEGKQEDLHGIAVYGDPGVAEAVKKDIFGVGYNNLNYAYDFNTGLPVSGIKIIPIDLNENKKIEPEEELNTKEQAINSITEGRYPSPPARELYIMTKTEFNSPTKEFVKWILTDGQEYVDETGYIQITELEINSALEKVGN